MTNESIEPRLRRPAIRGAVVLAPIVLAYYVLLGGAPAGELIGELRAVNVAIGIAIVGWVLLGPRLRTDRVDTGVAMAVALFSWAGVFSMAPRQSLDATLAALVYGAAFIGGRRLLASSPARLVVLRTMMVLSVIAIGLMLGRLATTYAAWESVTRWIALPPIGLLVSARPWGHPYDMALLGLITVPAWFTADPGRIRRTVGLALVPLLAAGVFLMGSRSVWLACVAGAVALVLPVVYKGRMRYLKELIRRHTAVSIAVCVLVILAVLLLAERLLVTATIGQRVAMWTAATQAWAARPITGAGPGTFPWILQTTGYFDVNSIAPRHPDSALFQLLPEAGLMGVAAVGALAATVGAAAVRRGGRPAVWSIVAFVAGAIAGNPTDFGFVVAIVLVWAAIATSVRPEVADQNAYARPLVITLAAPVVLALVAMTSAGILYDRASDAVASGRVRDAAHELDLAVALDPGMALYVRQRGTVALLSDDLGDAIKDLASATAINPNDDLAWRTLALAYMAGGQLSQASDAMRFAIHVQRSDPTNLLLAIHADLPALSGDDLVAEVVQAWPEIVLAPGWTQSIPKGMTTAEILLSAQDRWARSEPSPEPRGDQRFTTALLLGDRSQAAAFAAGIGIAPDLAAAEIAVVTCSPAANELVNEVRPVTGSPYYWRVLLQADQVAPERKRDAAKAYEILTSRSLKLSDRGDAVNPLQENDPLGYSGDVWGYRRLPIVWPSIGIELPNPSAGRIRFATAMRTALQEAGLSQIVGCSK